MINAMRLWPKPVKYWMQDAMPCAWSIKTASASRGLSRSKRISGAGPALIWKRSALTAAMSPSTLRALKFSEQLLSPDIAPRRSHEQSVSRLNQYILCGRDISADRCGGNVTEQPHRSFETSFPSEV